MSSSPLPDSQAPHASLHTVQSLLDRPSEQRKREYKYRCAQSFVFGLPVIFLQYFGASLGGPEAQRWIAILQALLTGWVMYVGAAGMVFEGLLTWKRRRTPDLIVSLLALGLYLYSLITVLPLLIGGSLLMRPALFHASVLLIGLWSGIQWFRTRSS